MDDRLREVIERVHFDNKKCLEILNSIITLLAENNSSEAESLYIITLLKSYIRQKEIVIVVKDINEGKI